jgi:membrane protein DedA with SNARE-associated domain
MTLETLVQHYGLAALLLGAAIEGEAVVVAGGLLARQGLFTLPGAIAAAAVGSFIADQCSFVLGRRHRDRVWVKRLQAEPSFSRALQLLERHPRGFIFAFRFIYGVRTISPLAIGTTRVPARTFFAVNVIAALVWSMTFVTIGYLFGHGFEAWIGHLHPHGRKLWWIIGALIGAALMFGTLRWLRSGWPC